MARKKREEFSEEQKAIAGDLDVAMAIETAAETPGGQIILEGLIADTLSAVDTLCAKYQTLTMQEFISLCADMKSKLDLAKAMARSKYKSTYLKKLLKESLAVDEE